MKRLLLLVVVLGAVFGGATAAQAHIQQFDVDAVFVDSQGQINGVTGTITCTRGERFAINGELFQGTVENPRESTAFFSVRGRCTGSTQRWFTDRVRQDGAFRCDQPAGAHATARTTFERRLHDSRDFDGTVQVVCR